MGSPLKPLTVKVAGAASETLAEAGETLPLAQDRLTLTEAELLSEKSLLTVNWAPADGQLWLMASWPVRRVTAWAPAFET